MEVCTSGGPALAAKEEEKKQSMINVVPFESEAFGAEILGLDLTQDISEEEVVVVKQAFDKYLVRQVWYKSTAPIAVLSFIIAVRSA